MQRPQMEWGMSSAPANCLAVAAQARAWKKFSRGIPACQGVPVGAPPGQTWQQAAHSPQRDCSTGVPRASGASVRMLFSRIADPYSSVTSSAHLPIHPTPARVL